MKKQKRYRPYHRKWYGLAVAGLALASQTASAQHDPLQPYQGKIGKTFKETQQWWPERKKAKAGAPNIVYIVIDDAGYGSSSAFGGLIPTPTLDSLANNGLRYTNFYTTAICSPTRASLLTGRNQHSVHIGENQGAGTPGYDRIIPFEKGFASEILRENGYNTYAVGKWHLTPLYDQTQAGPFHRWPTGRGFDHFYGFLPAATDQWHPLLWEDNYKVEKDDHDHQPFTTLITDKAIHYVAEQKSIDPDKPFFLYYAPGATHAPHHVPKEWINKFKGKFDQGWDRYREEVLARQKKLGVVPAYVQLPPTTYGVEKWDELSPEKKKLYARYFEIYAAQFAHLDHEIGRLVTYLNDIEQLENTLIFVSIGDNGASKEGNTDGTPGFVLDPQLSEAEKLKQTLAKIDLLGTEYSSPNYPQGWAQATNTPFRYLKQDANAEGGTHNPLIVFWPKGIKEKGTLRKQFAHVSDILPTTLELAGARVPEAINGYAQEPLEGTSFAYSLGQPGQPSRHTVQYFEIKGSRAIYKDGWKAGAYHVGGTGYATDKWELFNLNEDFNERFDLAAQYPQKLQELKDLFDAEAWKYNVYPLKDRTETPAVQEPGPFDGRDHIVLYGGISQVTQGPNLNNRSFSVTANVVLPAGGAEGVLFSNGGHFGGISLFVQNKKLQVVYNNGFEQYTLVADKQPLPTGAAQVKLDFQLESPGKGGLLSLSVNGAPAGQTTVRKLIGRTAEGISVGKDILTPVSPKYQTPFAFTGTVKNITIDIDAGGSRQASRNRPAGGAR
ncbi:arylsulfatase [Paraflavisolibacter sp. H34]|uniref:arylsulfatase n=1 Tax=Huijunlia imazamoxiresistens TaxID=3127457 RepID=UPI00301ABDC1